MHNDCGDVLTERRPPDWLDWVYWKAYGERPMNLSPDVPKEQRIEQPETD